MIPGTGPTFAQRIFPVLSALCLTGAVALGAIGDLGTRRCGGGEGPKPLVDVSATFPHDLHVVPTEYSPKEFFVWENLGQIVYRNDNTHLFSTTPSGDFKNFLSTSSKPISRVIDSEERFVITAGDTWFLDTWNGQNWIHYQAPFRDPEHLFWHGRKLYSMASVFNDSGDQTIKLSRYRAGDYSAHRICPLLTFSAGKGYHIGEGHVYPWVLLYKVKPTPKGNELTLDRLNVLTCGIEATTYADLVEGEIESVHWFPDINSVAVKIDHPTKNLLWDTGPDAEHCQFFDIGQKSPLIPLNHSHPVVASLDEEKGLRIFRLGKTLKEDSKAAQILKNLPIASVRPSEMWLTKDGKTLFVSPALADDSKVLLKVDMPDLYSSPEKP